MISEFFFLPATWMLIVIVGVMLWSRATTKEAAAGLICYTLSYLLSNAYLLGSKYGLAIQTWQAGLLLLLLMYCIVLKPPRKSWDWLFETPFLFWIGTSAIATLYLAASVVYRDTMRTHAVVAAALEKDLPPDLASTVWTETMAGMRPLPEMIVLLLIIAAAYLIYRKVTFDDPIAKMIWAVLIVAEAWQAIEYASCKIVSQPSVTLLIQSWGIEYDKQSCARAFGPVSPYIAPTITNLWLVWINVKKKRWRRTT